MLAWVIMISPLAARAEVIPVTDKKMTLMAAKIAAKAGSFFMMPPQIIA
jgi:hypothetical protein